MPATKTAAPKSIIDQINSKLPGLGDFLLLEIQALLKRVPTAPAATMGMKAAPKLDETLSKCKWMEDANGGWTLVC